MDCRPPGSSVHGDSAGKNTRVGCHALLQGIFPNLGTPGLPHCMQILYPLSHPGSLRRARMGFQGQKSLGLETQMSLSKSDGNPPFLRALPGDCSCVFRVPTQRAVEIAVEGGCFLASLLR